MIINCFPGVKHGVDNIQNGESCQGVQRRSFEVAFSDLSD